MRLNRHPAPTSTAAESLCSCRSLRRRKSISSFLSSLDSRIESRGPPATGASPYGSMRPHCLAEEARSLSHSGYRPPPCDTSKFQLGAHSKTSMSSWASFISCTTPLTSPRNFCSRTAFAMLIEMNPAMIDAMAMTISNSTSVIAAFYPPDFLYSSYFCERTLMTLFSTVTS